MLVPRSIALTVVALAGATVLQACGGGKEASQTSTSAANTATPANSTATAAPAGGAAAGAATVPPMPATGKTAKVQMIVDNKGDREDPVNVTVKVGDAVQWVNVSGGPHNILVLARQYSGWRRCAACCQHAVADRCRAGRQTRPNGWTTAHGAE